jgi:hypothetical protein
MKVNNLKFRIRTYFGYRDSLFFKIYKLKKTNYNRRCVNKDTDLVIEGYPRSANTFAVTAFRHTQCFDFKIAHHLHVPAQIIRGVKYKIPTLVLIRYPTNAIASFKVFMPDISLSWAIKYYISFYESIKPYKDKFISIDFNRIINQFDEAIKNINYKFKTNFSMPMLGENDIKCIFKEIDRQNEIANNGKKECSGRPIISLEITKQSIIEMLNSKKYGDLMLRAKKIYKDFSE